MMLLKDLFEKKDLFGNWVVISFSWIHLFFNIIIITVSIYKVSLLYTFTYKPVSSVLVSPFKYEETEFREVKWLFQGDYIQLTHGRTKPDNLRRQ